MNWSMKAILARFDGDSVAAIAYCEDMVIRYPRLAAEYTQYKLAIADETALAVGA
jgi:hypothetical protein